MCTEKYHGKEQARGVFMLRHLIRKLQRGLLFLATVRVDHDHRDFDHEDDRESEQGPESINVVPDDIKEGHFAVFAVKGGESKRFVVKLEFLNSPAFLRLLEQAEEEYGFEQTGTLVLPCKPEELQKILKMEPQ